MTAVQILPVLSCRVEKNSEKPMKFFTDFQSLQFFGQPNPTRFISGLNGILLDNYGVAEFDFVLN
ncbi:MAG: hypothetical protein IGR93_21910 [Hydrococcus sp. C42_A2020_068]|nr:hypothetical protein [Hydrococcus sp. C42_A2020_068]